MVRGLYVSYRSTFAASDMAVCNFVPSCSHFSEEAVRQCGFVRGVLLSADRLMRDHPYALPYYPADVPTGLLADPVTRYCESP
ncbi:MAG: membrane protein insertion efficiency factor YidD [bacterium]